MVQVLVDTSALVALAGPRDRFHEAATAYRRQLAGSDALVVSDYVFDETMTRLRMASGHRVAVAWGSALRASGLVRLVRLTETDFETAWQRFQQFSDQRLSFTDCTIVAMAERMRLRRIFTFDEDFRRLGYDVVPEP